MIAADQPTIFPSSVTVRLSSVQDGNINYHHGIDNLESARANRRCFIETCGGTDQHSSLVYVEYQGSRDFCRYAIAPGVNDNIQAELATDALATQAAGHGLFLPLADCCGVVLYDPKSHALMLSHIGRHSVEQYGARRSVQYMAEQYGSEPAELLVWLSPAAGVSNYPVFARQNRGLQDLISTDLAAAGVLAEHIEVAAVDTTTSPDYFSHSEWQKGNRSQHGRFAVFVMLQ